MSTLKILYFHMYNHYYDNGKIGLGGDGYKALILIALSFTFGITSIFNITRFYVYHMPILNIFHTILISIPTSIFCYYLFRYNNKHRKIYLTYHKSNKDTLLYKMTAFAFIISGFLIFILSILKINNKF